MLLCVKGGSHVSQVCGKWLGTGSQGGAATLYIKHHTRGVVLNVQGSRHLPKSVASADCVPLTKPYQPSINAAKLTALRQATANQARF